MDWDLDYKCRLVGWNNNIQRDGFIMGFPRNHFLYGTCHPAIRCMDKIVLVPKFENKTNFKKINSFFWRSYQKVFPIALFFWKNHSEEPFFGEAIERTSSDNFFGRINFSTGRTFILSEKPSFERKNYFFKKIVLFLNFNTRTILLIHLIAARYT